MLKDVDDVLETMRIGEEPPIDVEIQHIEIFFEFGSATDSKDFEALHNTVLGVDDQSLCSDVRTELNKCMMSCDDHLRCFSESLTN